MLSGEPGSHVFGSVSDGVFHGKIVSPKSGAWYVERAHYYFPSHEINETLHSVIYHENDVGDPYVDVRQGKMHKKQNSFFLSILSLQAHITAHALIREYYDLFSR